MLPDENSAWKPPTSARHGCCIAANWSRAFDEPIQPPKGKKLVTLKDAAAYIMKQPKSKRQSPECQAAAEALLMAAEDRGPLMHAHVGMMLALHGAKPIPEYDSSKEKHWGRRTILTLRRWRQVRGVKSAQPGLDKTYPLSDGGKRARSPGSTKETVKTIACGNVG